MKIFKANDAKDVFEMETSTKEIDKALSYSIKLSVLKEQE